MRNTGTSTWTAAAKYNLGAQNPQDKETWGITHVTLPSDVQPGSDVTFSFTVDAPTAPGVYNFQWQMTQDYVEWFGDYSRNAAVTVVPSSVYDAVADFSGVQNPAGVWNYGYRPSADAPLRLYPNSDPTSDPNVGTWHDSSISNPYNVPLAMHSSGAQLVHLHPGASGEQSVVKWTAPYAGKFQIGGRFENMNNATTDVHVTHNGVSVFDGYVNGAGSVVPFTLTRMVAAGDAIEFIVGAGGNGYGYDSTGLAATLTFKGSTSFKGRPAVIPGIQQAEDFDEGGEGVAYHDTDAGNNGGAYRNSDVDIAAGYGTGYCVGWTGAGEWLIYTLETSQAGVYDIEASVATISNGASFQINMDGKDVSTPVVIPYTGGWNTWQSVVKKGVTLSAGLHMMRITVGTGAGSNFDYFKLVATPTQTPVSSPTPVPTPKPTPTPVPSPTPISVEPTGGDTLMTRLEPGNRTGQEGVDLLSGNYNWSTPLVTLAGRAGLDLNLALVYNSLVWIKSQDGSSIQFDADRGFPGPGFRLGFPVVQPKYRNTQTGTAAYLMIMPSGERVELRQSGPGSNIYNAVNSSYLQLTEEGGGELIVRTTGGTQLRYIINSGEYHCTQVKDSNGNFLTSIYDSQGRITKVTDTLGRVLTFNYDSLTGHLASITQPWKINGQTLTHTWASFSYSDLVIQTNFGSLKTVGAQNGQSLRVLKRVTYADGSSHEFFYTTWGQVYGISRGAADGSQLRYTKYNLPLNDTSTSIPLNDCPRFTQQRENAKNWNGAGNSLNQSSEVTTSFKIAAVLGNGVGEITLPDGVVHKEYFGTAGWDSGLTQKVETWSAPAWANGVLKRTVTTLWTQDENQRYQLNPRPVDITITDGEGNRQRRTHYDYDPTIGFGLPVDISEYGPDNTTRLRHTHTSYWPSSYQPTGEYTSRHIIGLPQEQSVRGLENGVEKLVSKTKFEYDAQGEFLQYQGDATQHDNTSYGIGFRWRGNLGVVSRVNVQNEAEHIIASRISYNTNGSPVQMLDAEQSQILISYVDSNGGNTFAYPTKITDPDSFSATVEYNYDLGAATLTHDPKAAEQIMEYETATGRLLKTTYRDSIFNLNGTNTRFVYAPSQTQTESFTLLAPGKIAHNIQNFDGAGRLIRSSRELPGSAGGYSTQQFVYDAMGRLWKQSNPIETNASWQPTGDDDPGNGGTGWIYSEQQYDWKGRPTVSINQDGTRQTNTYKGCGCAGDEVVTSQDEMGRSQRITHDMLGRVVTVERLNLDGSTYTTLTNSYNGRDQIINAKMYAGVVSAGNLSYQESVFAYDGYGRLLNRKLPGEDSITTYQHRSDGLVEKIRDARGVTATYKYNARKLVTRIEYGVPIDPATGAADAKIPATPPVEFEYDEAGNRKLMRDGLGQVEYSYDTWSRLQEEKRSISGIGAAGEGHSYTLKYEYNLAGMLTKITDPFGAGVDYGYNNEGQLTEVKGSLYGGVTTYATDIGYRAWGDLKHVSYGDTRSLDLKYNSRLDVTRLDIPGVMVKGYQYDNDGRLRYSQDMLDARFDRSYKYDQVGRVTQALSGAEARGEAATNNRPYNQTTKYDEWNNITSRIGKHWTGVLKFSPSEQIYDLKNRNSTGSYDSTGNLIKWQYDAAGNLINSGDVQYKYDAAGRQAVFSTTSDGIVKVVTLTFDGNGQKVKQAEAEPGFTGNTYFVRSSLLGGQVLSEIDGNGEKSRTFVYAGESVLAWQQQAGDTQSVKWEHNDVSNASSRLTSSTGVVEDLYKVELDTLGMNAGVFNPYLNTSGPPRSRDRELAIEYGRYADMLNDGSTGCTVDGVMMPCSMARGIIRSGEGKQCPHNDCGPRLIKGRLSPLVLTQNGFGVWSQKTGRVDVSECEDEDCTTKTTTVGTPVPFFIHISQDQMSTLSSGDGSFNVTGADISKRLKNLGGADLSNLSDNEKKIYDFFKAQCLKDRATERAVKMKKRNEEIVRGVLEDGTKAGIAGAAGGCVVGALGGGATGTVLAPWIDSSSTVGGAAGCVAGGVIGGTATAVGAGGYRLLWEASLGNYFHYQDLATHKLEDEAACDEKAMGEVMKHRFMQSLNNK